MSALIQCHLIQLDPTAASAEALAKCRSLLSPAEQTRLQRFRRESAQREFLLGRALMRHEVGQRLGIPAPSVPFERSPQGKPFLADQSLHVNLSHTQGCLVLALCDTHAVGVDVEWLARPVRPALANKFFSPTEWAEINALPTEDDRRQRFLQVWTLKEAWWKAHDPPYGFDMTQLTAHWQPLALWNDAADQPLGTVQSWADAKHRFALAVTASDASLSVTQLPPSLLDLGR